MILLCKTWYASVISVTPTQMRCSFRASESIDFVNSFCNHVKSYLSINIMSNLHHIYFAHKDKLTSVTNDETADRGH